MGQKLPIEVQHAQKSTELTGSLRRVAVLEMGHSLFQRLGALSEHLVTKQGDLGCSEDALRRVDDDAVPLKLVEESPCFSGDREKTSMSSL
jgi:non-ribosomal peptide synthetase component E (peptide arylation enzyme)